MEATRTVGTAVLQSEQNSLFCAKQTGQEATILGQGYKETNLLGLQHRT